MSADETTETTIGRLKIRAQRIPALKALSGLERIKTLDDPGGLTWFATYFAPYAWVLDELNGSGSAIIPLQCDEKVYARRFTVRELADFVKWMVEWQYADFLRASPGPSETAMAEADKTPG